MLQIFKQINIITYRMLLCMNEWYYMLNLLTSYRRLIEVTLQLKTDSSADFVAVMCLCEDPSVNTEFAYNLRFVNSSDIVFTRTASLGAGKPVSTLR